MKTVSADDIKIAPLRALVVGRAGSGTTTLARKVIENSRFDYAAALVMGRDIDMYLYEQDRACEAFGMGDGNCNFGYVQRILQGLQNPFIVVDPISGLLSELSKRPHNTSNQFALWKDFLKQIGPVPGLLLHRLDGKPTPSGFDKIVNSFLGELCPQSKEFVSKIIQGSSLPEAPSSGVHSPLWWVDRDGVQLVNL